MTTGRAPIFGRFRAAERGAAAVEFALVMPLLFALLIGTFDAGGVMYKATLLERALDIATRRIRVDDPAAATDASQLKTQVCGATILKLPDCAGRLTIEMTVISDPADIPTASVTCVSKSVPKPVVSYAAGGRSELVYVRACLGVDPMVPLAAATYGLRRSSDGDFKIVAATTYTNEP